MYYMALLPFAAETNHNKFTGAKYPGFSPKDLQIKWYQKLLSDYLQKGGNDT